MTKFKQRVIKILGKQQKETAHAMIDNAPENAGLEIVLREEVKTRSLDANALMWAGTLKDISEQLFVNGKLFSAEAWHIHFKKKYLPDEANEPYLFELVKNPEHYMKWAYLPNGDRDLKGSTTDLTKYGFSQYLEQIHADASSEGVMFTTNKHE